MERAYAGRKRWKRSCTSKSWKIGRVVRKKKNRQLAKDAELDEDQYEVGRGTEAALNDFLVEVTGPWAGGPISLPDFFFRNEENWNINNTSIQQWFFLATGPEPIIITPHHSVSAQWRSFIRQRESWYPLDSDSWSSRSLIQRTFLYI